MLDHRIHTFLLLCKVMNFRKTADFLGITQPAVTQQIHSLENQYGQKLFLYENRRLVKTDAAAVLEKYARAAKLQEQDLREKLENNPIHSLRVGATKTIGDYYCDDGQWPLFPDGGSTHPYEGERYLPCCLAAVIYPTRRDK